MVRRFFLVLLPFLAVHSECKVFDRRGGIVVRPPPTIENLDVGATGVSNTPRPLSGLEDVPVPVPAAENVPRPPPVRQGAGTPTPEENDPEQPVVEPPPVGTPAGVDTSGEQSSPQPQAAPRPAPPPEQQQDPEQPNPIPNPSPKQPTPPKQPDTHPSDPQAAVFILPPIPKDDANLQDEAPLYDLGSYKANQEVLFGNFKGPQDILMSKVFDFFTAERSYITGDAYVSVTGSQQPFQNGPKPTGQNLRFSLSATQIQQEAEGSPSLTVTSFNPTAPRDICGVWTSLARYCSGGGTACACSSSSFYVPDLWNSLAAKCASLTTECDRSGGSTSDYWCQLGRAASNARGFCPTTDLASAVTPVKFAATAGLPTTASATLTGLAGYINSGISGSSAGSFPTSTSLPNTLTVGNEQSSSATGMLSLLRSVMASGLAVTVLFVVIIYS